MTNDERIRSFLNATLGVSGNKPEEEITITVLGLDRVGKSSLLHRCLFNVYEPMYSPTVEDLYKGQIVYNSQKYNMTIHEMGGTRQFPVMRQMLIKKSDGFILVYSVDSKPSFEEVRRLYDIIADVKGSRDVPVVLVGNKSDSPLRYINTSDVCTAIRDWGHKVQRVETSAKTGDNCRLMIDKLIRMIDERKHESLQLNTLHEMSQCPLHRLLSFLHVPYNLFSLDGIKNVVTCKKRRHRRRRRRRISSSSSSEGTMQLLYVSVLPLIPDVTEYVNVDW